MQINGASLSTVFIPRGHEAREPIRPPVIIDAEPQAREARPLLPATTQTAPYQAVITTAQDERQENFVRLFAGNREQDNRTSSTSTRDALPASVQQYIQIANLETGPQQRLFDEIV